MQRLVAYFDMAIEIAKLPTFHSHADATVINNKVLANIFNAPIRAMHTYASSLDCINLQTERYNYNTRYIPTECIDLPIYVLLFP